MALELLERSTSHGHRRYARGNRLGRLQVQLDPGIVRRIKKIALITGESRSGIAAKLIEGGLPAMEAPHEERLALITDEQVDALP